MDIDKRQIKKVDWQFNWHKELKDKTKELYKLTTKITPKSPKGDFWSCSSKSPLGDLGVK